MGFAATASAAVTDEPWAIGSIAEARGSAGFELAGVETDAGPGEIEELIGRTTGFEGESGVLAEVHGCRMLDTGCVNVMHDA
jgi:hypothetical protein